MGISKRNFVNNILSVYVEPIAFIVFFYLIINRIIFGGGWLQISESTFEKVFKELVLWVLDGVLFLWIASQKKNLLYYLTFWKKNWLLLVFIIFAACSVFWSEFLAVTFYKVFVLIACSSIAAYIGMTYSLTIILRKLSIYMAIIIILSYGLALLVPSAGTHVGWPYFGAWRGLFFHKNYLGTIMAFSSTVFLFLIFMGSKLNIRFLNISLFILSAGLVVLGRSATGVILFVILNAGILLIIAWIKWKRYLHQKHYIFLGIILIGGIILALLNLDFVFGLLNKETTLTGRLPMWEFLIKYTLENHPIAGSGFGAIWASNEFRQLTLSTVGWGVPSLSSDNGFVDFFLHLGLLGFILFSFCLILYIIRLINYVVKEQTLISFFPIMSMTFLIIVNISVSFFLEFESFGWFLLVYTLFATTRGPTQDQLQPVGS